jgi:hypothetical protein
LWTYGRDGEVGRTHVESCYEDVTLGNSLVLVESRIVRSSALNDYDQIRDGFYSACHLGTRC